MSVESLNRRKVYVLGPLELSPNQFAVGERSYAAIKGKMPYYNSIRQNFYLKGKRELGDAIGELEARAIAAEKALEEMTSEKKSAETKTKSLLEDNKKLEHEITSLKKEIDKIKSNKKYNDINKYS